MELDDLTVNISKIDTDKIKECWTWLLKKPNKILLVSKIGDMFLEEGDGAVYWLAADSGELSKIAQDITEFELLLNDDENIDNWFLPKLIELLNNNGIVLNSGQVYHYKKLPVLGGEYVVDNIESVDIYIHFVLTGEMHRQIQELPKGTKVTITITE